MRSKIVLCLVLGLATVAFAKDRRQYQRGKLLQMDSVPCSVSEKNATSSAGTDSDSEKAQDVLCREYVLEAEHVTYHVRPRNENHPVLLPIGGDAQFRLEKDKMLLRVNLGQKEHEYIVVSMTPRSDGNTADTSPTRLNHLQ